MFTAMRTGTIVLVAGVFLLVAGTAEAKKAKRKTTTSIATEPIGGPKAVTTDDGLPPLTAAPKPRAAAAPAAASIVPLKPGEHPSAVQVCFDLPDGMQFVSKYPLPGYLQADDGSYALAIELTLNGRFVPEKLARAGTNCVRAYVPPMHLTSVAVSFDKSYTNLVRVEKAVDLKMKKDKWHDAGRVTVTRGAWAKVQTALAGRLTVFRVESSGRTRLSNNDQVAHGRYAIDFEPQAPPSGPCLARVTPRATGSITATTNAARLGQLVADYERDVVTELLRERSETCNGYERLEFAIDVRDGRIVDPWHPRVERVKVPPPAVSYALRVAGSDKPYVLGSELDLADGDTLELVVTDSQPADTLPALVTSQPSP